MKMYPQSGCACRWPSFSAISATGMFWQRISSENFSDLMWQDNNISKYWLSDIKTFNTYFSVTLRIQKKLFCRFLFNISSILQIRFRTVSWLFVFNAQSVMIFGSSCSRVLLLVLNSSILFFNKSVMNDPLPTNIILALLPSISPSTLNNPPFLQSSHLRNITFTNSNQS